MVDKVEGEIQSIVSTVTSGAFAKRSIAAAQTAKIDEWKEFMARESPLG